MPEIKMVPFLQFRDYSPAEKNRLWNECAEAKYPNNVNLVLNFSDWRVTVDYAEGTKEFQVEPGDLVVWQDKVVLLFCAETGMVTAYNCYLWDPDYSPILLDSRE